jgi:hypothetical protein
MEMCDKMETDFKNGSYLMLKNSQVMVRQYQKLEYVRKLIAQGNKPDIILLDYIDCVEPSKLLLM